METTLCIFQLLGAIVAGMAASMQGTVYGFPTRALPQLVLDEDSSIRLSTQEASWFGKLEKKFEYVSG